MPGAQLVAQPGIGAVGTPLPQTTADTSPNGPFVRYARNAQRPGYGRTGDAFGISITNPLSSAPGYLKGLWITVTASGGAKGAATVEAAADAPFNVIQFLQLKDPWGTPVVTVPGWELAKVINTYGGQAGLFQAADPANLPSYSAPDANGNFQFKVYVPLEAVKGYGVMSIGNSSVMPTLFINYAGSAVVYTTAPDTLPTLAIQVDEDYYDIDPTNPVEPPGNGTSLQWSVAQANSTVGSQASQRLQLPHTGGFLTTLGLILRDSTGARIDGYNTTGRLRIYVDGIPQYDMTWLEWVDHMYMQQGGGFARPTGVVAVSFKTSLATAQLGLLDSQEQLMQTTPGTQIEVEMTPWGTIANAPATLNVIYGQIVPSGRIQQGFFEA